MNVPGFPDSVFGWLFTDLIATVASCFLLRNFFYGNAMMAIKSCHKKKNRFSRKPAIQLLNRDSTVVCLFRCNRVYFAKDNGWTIRLLMGPGGCMNFSCSIFFLYSSSLQYIYIYFFLSLCPCTIYPFARYFCCSIFFWRRAGACSIFGGDLSSPPSII